MAITISNVESGSISTLYTISGSVVISGGTVPAYTGEYEVTPLAQNAVVLETQGKKMLDDVTVKKIPYYETTNQYGNTVYIASEV